MLGLQPRGPRFESQSGWEQAQDISWGVMTLLFRWCGALKGPSLTSRSVIQVLSSILEGKCGCAHVVDLSESHTQTHTHTCRCPTSPHTNTSPPTEPTTTKSAYNLLTLTHWTFSDTKHDSHLILCPQSLPHIPWLAGMASSLFYDLPSLAPSIHYWTSYTFLTLSESTVPITLLLTACLQCLSSSVPSISWQ